MRGQKKKRTDPNNATEDGGAMSSIEGSSMDEEEVPAPSTSSTQQPVGSAVTVLAALGVNLRRENNNCI